MKALQRNMYLMVVHALNGTMLLCSVHGTRNIFSVQEKINMTRDQHNYDGQTGKSKIQYVCALWLECVYCHRHKKLMNLLAENRITEQYLFDALFNVCRCGQVSWLLHFDLIENYVLEEDKQESGNSGFDISEIRRLERDHLH